MKILVALFCGFIPWFGVLIGGYVTPWIASLFNVQLSFNEGMILSGILWLMSQNLQDDAKRKGIL